MKKGEFDNLELNKRATLLWEKGEFISHIEYGNRRICLYILEGNYVEVYYSIEENMIENIQITNNEKRIQNYLMNIDLQEYI